MRIEVIIGSKQELDSAIAAPDCPESGYRDYYLEQLKKISESKQETADFRTIIPSERQSANFQSMSIIERAIVDHLTANEFPAKVRIVCEDEDTARLYKVVYNYFFADTKLDRLEDSNWD